MHAHRGNWQVHATDTIYDTPWMKVLCDTVTDPGGAKTIFSYVGLKNGVSVLPLTSDNQVYLVERYRYATDTVGLELVTGAINKDETPIKAAQRELCEELKLEAAEWIELGSVYPFPDKVDQQESLFIAKDVKLSQKSLEQDTSEYFNIVTYPFEQVVEWVMDGTIDHALSSVTIMKAVRFLGF